MRRSARRRRARAKRVTLYRMFVYRLALQFSHATQRGVPTFAAFMRERADNWRIRQTYFPNPNSEARACIRVAEWADHHPDDVWRILVDASIGLGGQRPRSWSATFNLTPVSGASFGAVFDDMIGSMRG